MKPDFVAVTTPAAAQALAARGRLVAVLAFPAELGGPDDSSNRVYITPEAAGARALIIGTLRRMVADGTIDHMDVTPIYRGASVVPISLRMKASGKGKAGSFEATVDVW